MNYKSLDDESTSEAIENMRTELAALEGALEIVQIAAGTQAFDLNNALSDAAYGARMVVRRQEYRLDRHRSAFHTPVE